MTVEGFAGSRSSPKADVFIIAFASLRAVKGPPYRSGDKRRKDITYRYGFDKRVGN